MMISISQILDWIPGRVANSGSISNEQSDVVQARFSGINTLENAGAGEIAFFFSKHYQADLIKSRAGLIVTGDDFVGPLSRAGIPQWNQSVFVSCPNPYLAMAILTEKVSRSLSSHDHQVQQVGHLLPQIHSTAVVHATAKLAAGVIIHPYAVIDANVVIGEGSVIYPHCYLGPGSKIGCFSILFPNVTVYENTQIGDRCRIHAGVVLGADGFGYAPKVENGQPVGHQKIYHLGRVLIGNDVEVGANSSIDRGTLGDTVIENHVKIDNQVQIGHNCKVGEGSILCGCSGMAGSSSLGRYVILGAQSGTSNQVHVGDGSKVAAYTGISKDLPAESEVMGIPARPLRDFFKVLALQNRMLKRGKS